MACPVCSGTQRAELAPGFFECQTVLAVTAPGPGYGALPTGQFGPQHITTHQTCGQRYQEGAGASAGLVCVADCGRFAVGRCSNCGQPVCGLCSPGNGPLLCPEHRDEANAAAVEYQAELERQRAAAPEARARRAAQLAYRQRSEFKEQMKRSGWAFEPADRSTITLLRNALPELRQRAADRAESITIMRSFGRTVQVTGWIFGSYKQESGNERDPGPEATLIYVLCDDGTVRVADRGVDGLWAPKYRGALQLDTGIIRDGTVHHDQGGRLLFGNTVSVSWAIRELLDEGTWDDLVLADLEGSGG